MPDYPRTRALIAELANVQLSEVQQPIAQLVAEQRDLFLAPLRYVASQMEYEGDGVHDNDTDPDGEPADVIWSDLAVSLWTQRNFPAIKDENLYGESSEELDDARDALNANFFTREEDELFFYEGHISPLVKKHEQDPTQWRQIMDIFGEYYFGDFFKSYEPAIDAYEAGVLGDVDERYVAVLEAALGLNPVIRELIVKLVELGRAKQPINWWKPSAPK